jgi:hypothetical protein
MVEIFEARVEKGFLLSGSNTEGVTESRTYNNELFT